MNNNATMMEIFGHGEDYYTKEYQNTWKNDLNLLERMTDGFSKEETERIYDMINGETHELMDMIKYIASNKN